MVSYPDYKRTGFTLVELLVVLAIVGLLAGILFPVLSRTREDARRGACSGNLRQLQQAIILYTNDQDETLPVASYNNLEPYLPVLVAPYVKSGLLWKCPSDGSADDTFDGRPEDTSVSYGYNWNLGGRTLGTVVDSSNTAALADGTSFAIEPTLANSDFGTGPDYRHTNQAVVAWLDGHLSSLTQARLESLAVTDGPETCNLPGSIDCYRYWSGH